MSMTPRELWLAAVRMEPVDRLPFWPKLDAAYPHHREAPFRDMTLADIHNWVGSDRHEGVGSALHERRQRTREEQVRDGDILRTIYHTPRGSVELVRRFDPGSQSWHPIQFPVRTLEDIKLMTDWFADCTPDINGEALQAAKQRCGELGDIAITATTIGESPLMYWVEWLAGVENAHLLLADHREAVEELFEALHQVLLEKTRLVAETSPADIIYFSENTSTTLISPAQYERYCFRHISDYGHVLQGAGRLFVLHMCGLLKHLLPQLSRVPANAFEAFTSPTLGDTTLLDGRTGCPDKCLVGGTNAVLWTRSASRIIAQIEEDLGALSHHRGIVVTSAGVMTPLCEPETIREVCDWVKRYPPRL